MHDERSDERRLAALFRHGEWASERAWLGRRLDRNPFVSANILLILEQAGVTDPELQRQRDEARDHLAAYCIGHQFYHWPVEAGRSVMANAPGPWRAAWSHLSPDADCTSLAYLARPDSAQLAAVLDDLAFYRADNDRFRLPRFQRDLPSVADSFLTWFPPRERCHGGKLETVDAGADANILWFLAANGRLDAPGAAETLRFLAEVVRHKLLLCAPFRVSMYYPKPAVLLYLVARAAAWGKIDALLALKPALLEQVERCPAPTVLEQLCRASAAHLLGGALPDPLPQPDGRGAFYVGPLLAWPAQRFAPLVPVAAHPALQLEFRSEALEWALSLALRA